MRNAFVHDLPVHHVGFFSLIHPVCPALPSWQGRTTSISKEKYTTCISKTAYQYEVYSSVAS